MDRSPPDRNGANGRQPHNQLPPSIETTPPSFVAELQVLLQGENRRTLRMYWCDLTTAKYRLQAENAEVLAELYALSIALLDAPRSALQRFRFRPFQPDPVLEAARLGELQAQATLRDLEDPDYLDSLFSERLQRIDLLVSQAEDPRPQDRDNTILRHLMLLYLQMKPPSCLVVKTSEGRRQRKERMYHELLRRILHRVHDLRQFEAREGPFQRPQSDTAGALIGPQSPHRIVVRPWTTL